MIIVLNYGMGNIHSIIKALELYYPDVRFTNDIKLIKNAKGLVLPGDGHFHTAMNHLEPIKDYIIEYVNNHKPLLGICIGFQILFEDSDEVLKESQKMLVNGLGIIPGKIRRFNLNKNYRIPHMGWNKLIPNKDRLDKIPIYYQDYMYFIHSYRAVEVEDQFVETYTQYGTEIFPSTVRFKSILACQYHPEKSDKAGLYLIKDWIEQIKKA